jgi:5-methylcytosine-specific restriction endonuclease McrA
MKSKTKEYQAKYWKEYRKKYMPYKVKLCVECRDIIKEVESNAQKRCVWCRYIICVYCGVLFKPPNSNYNRKYCNRKCKDNQLKESLNGKEPLALQHNRGRKPRTYHLKKRDKHGSALDRDWRSLIFKRDNYTCRGCGSVGGRLEAHHIKSYKGHPELRHDVSNGLTLCIDCHKKTDTYGWANYWKSQIAAKRLAQEVMCFE